MEILRNLDLHRLPTNTLRAVSLAALLLAVRSNPVQARYYPEDIGHNHKTHNHIELSVTCTSLAAYGIVPIGLHPDIYVKARGLKDTKTQTGGGTWLYIGKLYDVSGDPSEARGYRVVGYDANPDGITANMDGYIGSIRGQDADSQGQIKPITFYDGDVISVMVRRGEYQLGLPATEYLDQSEVVINCSGK